MPAPGGPTVQILQHGSRSAPDQSDVGIPPLPPPPMVACSLGHSGGLHAMLARTRRADNASASTVALADAPRPLPSMGSAIVPNAFARTHVPAASAPPPPPSALPALTYEPSEYAMEADDEDPMAKMEAEFLKAAAARAEAKENDKDNAKKERVLKRPAAAADAPPLLKRPASTSATPKAASLAAVNMSDVYAKVVAIPKSKFTFGSFTSRFYDTAVRRSKSAGLTQDETKALARYHYAKASNVWASKK